MSVLYHSRRAQCRQEATLLCGSYLVVTTYDSISTQRVERALPVAQGL
jgi:hypothetical protein